MSRVTTEITDHIAHVRLSRPEKRNAVDPAMAEAIVAAGQALMDADIRAVVLSGEGEAFCAGLDVMSFAQLAAGDPEALVMPRTHGNANLFQEVALIWRKLPVPVIAALQGAVYGAGFQLALGADVRIAAPGAKLAIMEMKWGLVPDMGGMALLPHLTRSDVIRQMTYSATPISAQQAADWGLVTEIADDPLAVAQALASEIAGNSPSAMRAAKALIEYAESGASSDDVLIAESRAQTDLIGKPDQMEVISANMAGRAPRFTTRG
ncbi:crotonase/enoyl-CoA hydratase family protein [Pseudohalocynthiibacter aestuariivivens]|nr:crotonase/enoyl-CoA hydratase family protein [Pseudohalocynthiibacter aestuariivivens]QIE45368.1 crotonase/enoyl-CoA hydratase family protein [Pseudohalocynthiibacter aestuariivivens]